MEYQVRSSRTPAESSYSRSADYDSPLCSLLLCSRWKMPYKSRPVRPPINPSKHKRRHSSLSSAKMRRHARSAWHCSFTLLDQRKWSDSYRWTSSNGALQNGRIDSQGLLFLKDCLFDYIRSIYANLATEDSAAIQNKLTQTMTYLFALLYPTQWQSFFEDFRGLAGNESVAGPGGAHGTILYLRILGSVHDEIADTLLFRSMEEQKRNTTLKDLIRDRDAARISLSWQEILARWRVSNLSIVEMCLKVVSRWVSWVDIALVANQSMLEKLLDFAGQQDISPTDKNKAKVSRCRHRHYYGNCGQGNEIGRQNRADPIIESR